MKRLLALCGLYPLVWTRDFDGEVRLRIARPCPFGGWTCHAVAFCSGVIMNRDGTTSGKCYVREWREWKRNRRHVVFEDAV